MTTRRSITERNGRVPHRADAEPHSADAEETPAPPAITGLSPLSLVDGAPASQSLYFNRELSFIAYRRRLLAEAEDSRYPLLERVKMLAIAAGNDLDEFTMTRVSGLMDQVAAGVVERTPDGLTPREELAAVRAALKPFVEQARNYLLDTLLPLLRQHGICVERYASLSEDQQHQLARYFEQEVFPVCTPLAIDAGHPFPFISNLSVNLFIRLHGADGRQLMARLKVPSVIPQLVPVPAAGGVDTFVWLEELLAAQLEALFPGMVIDGVTDFRVVRDADVEIQDLESADLLETVEEVVDQRRFGSVVLLQIHEGMSAETLALLTERLKLTPDDVQVVRGPLALSGLMELTALDRPALKDAPFVPRVPAGMGPADDLFVRIAGGDVLLNHPFDAFSPVVDFLSRSATDPAVLAIKQTLYRVGPRSPVVEALREAVEWGKQVAVLVELKARWDEENNIEWARALEEAGVHVAYGLLGLKTHCKLALVVRKEREGLRRYVHLGTGNYNPSTARTYVDFGLFTANDEIAADVSDIFNYLTGYSRQTEYRKLLVAPVNLRQGLLTRIEREIDCARRQGGGRLIFKCNSLIDPDMIDALYRASQAGVRVELIVRGACCLRPGLPGVSERVRVVSIVGRFLEHSRLYYFENGGQEELYLGSADLMPRNLDHRVETLAPVEDPALRAYLREDVLEGYLRDNVEASELLPDGSYRRIEPGADPPFSIWTHLLERAQAESASTILQDRLASARGAYRQGRVDPYN
jgi:polyphosphate kinase